MQQRPKKGGAGKEPCNSAPNKDLSWPKFLKGLLPLRWMNHINDLETCIFYPQAVISLGNSSDSPQATITATRVSSNKGPLSLGKWSKDTIFLDNELFVALNACHFILTLSEIE